LQQKDRPIKLKIQDCNKRQTDKVKDTSLQQKDRPIYIVVKDTRLKQKIDRNS